MKIQITLHDGRVGRDATKVDEHGYGEILGRAEVDEPLAVGDKVRLADGTEMFVIGLIENLEPTAWTQRLAVSDLPARDE